MAKEKTEIERDLEIGSQIRSEFNEAESYLTGKLEYWRKNLKLYANQRKDQKAVGDNTMYTIHQTFLASIYNDKLSVNFLPREYGDTETAEILNQIAEFDYDNMEKSALDYDWDWNALFYGRSIMELKEFDRKNDIPVPRVWDTINTLPDPWATSVNGKNGDGACRFIGRMVQKTKHQMKKEDFKNLDNLGDWKPSDQLEQTQQARDDARGLTYQGDKLTGENKLYNILEWYTHIDGKKVFFSMGAIKETDANNKSGLLVLKETVIKNQDRWPLIDRAPMPIPGEWYGLSIPDLTEDKQRAKAILKNISIDTTKFGTYNRWMYNSNKIKNKSDLNINQNKNIEVDGTLDGAIKEVPKPSLANGLDFILGMIDRDAQTATATPDVKQGGVQRGVETLGEIEKISQNAANRYGLAISLFEKSEMDFWRQWYWLYKNFFTGDIGEKAVRLKGTYGTEFRKFTPGQIKMLKDPDVKIRSISEKKRADREGLIFLSTSANIVATQQDVNKREWLRAYFEKGGMTIAQINRMLPPTPDELDAEDENVEISKDKFVKAELKEDHVQHINIHRRAAETAAKKAHILQHREFLKVKKAREPQQPEEVSNNQARVPEAQFQNADVPVETE